MKRAWSKHCQFSDLSDGTEEYSLITYADVPLIAT